MIETSSDKLVCQSVSVSSLETVCLTTVKCEVLNKESCGTCQQSVEVLSKSVTFLDFRLSKGSVEHTAGEVEIYVICTQRIFLRITW